MLLFLRRGGSEFSSYPSQSSVYVMATGGVGRGRAGVIRGDKAAGLALLDKHSLGCSFKEANLDFDKSVVRDFLYLHVCFYRDCAISGVSHISWPPLHASNSIVSPVSLELEAKSASRAMPALICPEALFSLL